jgi:FkbM family methyltransferase
MRGKMKRFLRKVILKYIIPQSQISYSQFGEDLIFSLFFSHNGITNPTYLDIGANEPRFISNTFYFYEKGSRGVLIEPNPFLFKKLQKERPFDIVLNIGIGFTNVAEADFYMFPDYANGLSTFSKKEADHWANTGMKGMGKIPIEKVIKMPLVPINKILEKYFSEKPPDVISLDVEGLDLEILKAMDFQRFKPALICVETLMYDENQKTFKTNEITDFMGSKDYFVYADTRVNTIYAHKDFK